MVGGWAPEPAVCPYSVCREWTGSRPVGWSAACGGEPSSRPTRTSCSHRNSGGYKFGIDSSLSSNLRRIRDIFYLNEEQSSNASVACELQEMCEINNEIFSQV